MLRSIAAGVVNAPNISRKMKGILGRKCFPKSGNKALRWLSPSDAGVVDSRSVEQDAEKEEGESGNSKGAVDKRPNELSILFCFNRLDHIGETKESS